MQKSITADLDIGIPSISKRDLMIVDLRDRENKKFTEIADEVVKLSEATDYEGQINEDSIKKAYHRAIEKINSIAHPRDKNLG